MYALRPFVMDGVLTGVKCATRECFEERQFIRQGKRVNIGIVVRIRIPAIKHDQKFHLAVASTGTIVLHHLLKPLQLP